MHMVITFLHLLGAILTVGSISSGWRIQERRVEFSLEENCQIGTKIGSVAMAPVKSRYPIQPKKHVFGSSSSLFIVNQDDGTLRTKTSIDAEQLCAQARQIQTHNPESKQSAIQARKSDGETSLDDRKFVDEITCTQDGRLSVHVDVNSVRPDGSLRAVHRVTIRIHDVDDNGPKFSQVRWHKRLKEVLYRKGRKLELPKAKDTDLLAEHSRISYRLEARSKPENAPSSSPDIPFHLEVSKYGQPVLVLTEDLDAETKDRHQFLLVAYSPTPDWSSVITPKWSSNGSAKVTEKQASESVLEIDIEVADMNDNEPRFDSTTFNVSVAEDTPTGTVIYQLVADDPDSTAQLVYSMDISNEGVVMRSTFIIESNGRVRIRSFLDYELRHTYNIPVKVSDGEFAAQAQLLVHVLDVNDEAPSFEINPKRLVADENASAGKLIGRVRIQDPDSDSVNGKVHCWEPTNLNGRQLLTFSPDPSINPTSTVFDLVTRVELDREVMLVTDGKQHQSLLIYLVCSDGNDESGTVVKHTSTMTATLHIRDVNDHKPVFTQQIYQVQMYENNLLNEKVIQVNATDADEGPNAKLTYSLLDRTNFKVDSLTGWVTASIVFDRETRSSYQLSVIAMDQGEPRLSASALINITILDRNDNAPTLLQFESDWDVDLSDTTRLDTGSLGERNVFAVRENLPAHTYLGNVLATDPDLGLNRQMQFELINDPVAVHADRFHLLPNGSLYTATKLDREEKEHYQLTVRVRDQSMQGPLSSTGTISIVVVDENDNAPHFDRPTGLLLTNVTSEVDSNILYDEPADEMKTSIQDTPNERTNIGFTPSVHLSVRENPGHVVITLHAKDPDAGVNGRVFYTLADTKTMRNNQLALSKHLRLNPLFHLKPDQGDVIVSRHMLAGDIGMHLLVVKASDNGSPRPKSDSKILAISIEDIPALGDRRISSHASSYYSNNQTKFAFTLWNFNGKNNVFIITLLASVSGLLASVLITAILCVSGVCTKQNRGACCHSHGQRPATSPGCSNACDGYFYHEDDGLVTNGRSNPFDGSENTFSGSNRFTVNGYFGSTFGPHESSNLIGGVNGVANDWTMRCGNNVYARGEQTFSYKYSTQNVDGNRSAEETYHIEQWLKELTDPEMSIQSDERNEDQPEVNPFSPVNNQYHRSVTEQTAVRMLGATFQPRSDEAINSTIILPRSTLSVLEQNMVEIGDASVSTFRLAHPKPISPNILVKATLSNIGQKPLWNHPKSHGVDNQALKSITSREVMSGERQFRPISNGESPSIEVPEMCQSELFGHDSGTVRFIEHTSDSGHGASEEGDGHLDMSDSNSGPWVIDTSQSISKFEHDDITTATIV